MVLPPNCSSYPSAKFDSCGFYSPQRRHHREAQTISKALQSQREMAHLSEAVRGRRAEFIETIKNVWREKPAAGTYSKDDVNLPERVQRAALPKGFSKKRKFR